jgi:fructose-bisphosphate aldolase class I
MEQSGVMQNRLVDTANRLVASGRGLLAMDESNATCNKRFAQAGIAQTVEQRRAWRHLLITAPGLGTCISGAILYDETIRQADADGVSFVDLLTRSGILPGIKVDAGAKPMAGQSGEKITEGLDGLRERLQDYAKLGAVFAKWRAVIALDAGLPTRACVEANAHALARYAALCQENDIVPIVEPEILMDGSHTIEQCRVATEEVLHTVFEQLYRQGALLEGMILKPNMVLPGLACAQQDTVEVVAEVTMHTLLRVVPADVPGIAFLSGGQSGELASARLNQMNVLAKTFTHPLPWKLAFSYARAIQMPALDIWHGKPSCRAAAQEALQHRARCNLAAMHGEYAASMEIEHA